MEATALRNAIAIHRYTSCDNTEKQTLVDKYARSTNLDTQSGKKI